MSPAGSTHSSLRIKVIDRRILCELVVVLPIFPNLVNEGMLKEKLQSVGRGEGTHISTHSAVNCVMEEIELKQVELS